MKPLLTQYGVTVIAVSKDAPELVRAHRERDGLTFPLLSDPELALITRMGLLHEAGLEFKTFLVGPTRFPLGWPTRYKRMAIPTTLILDEQHTVRWIDQADDYRLRGDVARIEGALAEVFGELKESSG